VPTEWAIIADDLTGAADATGRYGAIYSSAVVLDLDATWPNVDILAIDTESRHLSEEHAAALVSSVARRSIGEGRRVFKKVDSLLRGNIGAEIGAAFAELTLEQHGLALVAPAFPATGRTTVHGIVHVDGVPRVSGRFRGDVAQPLTAAGLRTARVLATPGRTPQALARHLTQLQSRGLDAIVLDAACDEDLETVARAAELLEFPVLLAGSGGLAAHIAPIQRGAVHRPLDRNIARALIVVGSFSDLARSQLQELIGTGAQHVQLSSGESLDSGAQAQPVQAQPVQGGRDVVLTPDLTRAVDTANAGRVAASLAAAAAAIIDRYDLLVLTGGETAHAVMDALGVSCMSVLGELEPGVILSRLPGDMPLVVTKAGTFGDSGTLVRTIALLKATTRKASITP
jgi:D-threonate/D-erythronate kinase